MLALWIAGVHWEVGKPLPPSLSWSLSCILVGSPVWSPLWGLGYWFLLPHSPTLSLSICHHIHSTSVIEMLIQNAHQLSWELKHSTEEKWRCFPVMLWQLLFLCLCSRFSGVALPNPAVCTPPSIHWHCFTSSLELRTSMLPAHRQCGLSASYEHSHSSISMLTLEW